nr:MAG TPA: hypothetical protein [Caudoviricetes sp.]
MKNPRIDFKELDYFLKALAAFDFSTDRLMSALYYYCDARQDLGYAARLYVVIWKNCSDEQKQYFKDYFKVYKKIPSFDYLWNWYFHHNTADQSFELKASKALFNLLINDITLCNDLIDSTN